MKAVSDTWCCEFQGTHQGKGRRKAGRGSFGDKAMFSLKILLLLLLLHEQLSKGFPVPSESPEEKNAKIAQVN